MGSRTSDTDAGKEWLKAVGGNAQDRKLRGRGGVWRNYSRLHQRRELARTVTSGRRGKFARKDSHPGLQPARLLKGIAAVADCLQHRFAWRASPARVGPSTRREGARHHELENHRIQSQCCSRPFSNLTPWARRKRRKALLDPAKPCRRSSVSSWAAHTPFCYDHGA